MEIKLSKEEVQGIVNVLGEAPGKYVYSVIKLLEIKISEAEQAAKEEKKEE